MGDLMGKSPAALKSLWQFPEIRGPNVEPK